MFNVTVSLHPLKINSKQEANNNVGNITNELASCSVSLPFDKFIQALSNGQTWSGAIFKDGKKKAENWYSQSVFAIDVDNNEDIIKLDDLADHYTNIGFPPNACYYSLSSTPERPKFRLIWAVDQPVIDPIRAKNFKRWLIFNSLGYADSCTINLDRLYFGGKVSEILHEDPIPVEILPGKEKKKKKKDKKKIRGDNNFKSELCLAQVYVAKCFANPYETQWVTRYKTIFNGAVYLVAASNGHWQESEILKFVEKRMEENPEYWKNYHHTIEEIEQWIERAVEWANEKVF